MAAGAHHMQGRPSSLVLPILEECETPNADETPKSIEDIIKKFDPENLPPENDGVNNNVDDDDLPLPPDVVDNANRRHASESSPTSSLRIHDVDEDDEDAATLPPPPEFSTVGSEGHKKSRMSSNVDFTKAFVDDAENNGWVILSRFGYRSFLTAI